MTYEIAGARCTASDPQEVIARTQAWAAAHHAEVLLADASVVIGRDHLETAVRHALRAKASGVGVARDLGLETLRYLCGKRQLSEAIRAGGLTTATRTIAAVVFESAADDFLAHQGWKRDDSVLEAEGKSLRVLGITAREEQTVAPDRVSDLALERTALLDIEK